MVASIREGAVKRDARLGASWGTVECAGIGLDGTYAPVVVPSNGTPDVVLPRHRGEPHVIARVRIACCTGGRERIDRVAVLVIASGLRLGTNERCHVIPQAGRRRDTEVAGRSIVGFLEQNPRNGLLERCQRVVPVWQSERVALCDLLWRTRIDGRVRYERAPFEHNRVVAIQRRVYVGQSVGKRKLLQLTPWLRQVRL